MRAATGQRLEPWKLSWRGNAFFVHLKRIQGVCRGAVVDLRSSAQISGRKWVLLNAARTGTPPPGYRNTTWKLLSEIWQFRRLWQFLDDPIFCCPRLPAVCRQPQVTSPMDCALERSDP